jgi:hypothetical protein
MYSRSPTKYRRNLITELRIGMDNLVLVSGINQCPGKKVEIENGSADQINVVLCGARSGRGYDEYKRERES